MAAPVRLFDLENRIWCVFDSVDARTVQERFPGRFSKTETAAAVVEVKSAQSSSPAPETPATPPQPAKPKRPGNPAGLAKAREARMAKRAAQSNGAFRAVE